ncbi:bifunctional N-acetylglucosamine-1-phosphate uridyltransferase / glucosamine-1-phosphate N-acetyltransferase [Legionella quinlivanii]|uniref:Bifunctional protein GlmU n=1 Tax=Legionella quinlivanii TaxID=45073 RepID=A0A0W0Y4K2_9GAMM|nr:bifunctional UDP-N-acetylglucosamine diphosphorylase/glucosamine-1-phosphate N-acetyltransferase GlmU [Legionella quinlivanii]KTD51901.1 bifunctional N-acetylglucosamine-1-phosphate uridyltransferase / glucosamine-1-phosphate N-acetyltransferase [Legionella quinlivanii]SEF84333.1 UDP-N-acetylglucosamine pyrophosphorylase [Legionella quinlivanii DSM 21216]STY09637.1 UDP-N-acetylglucosamine pyrophosphorylase [Legionella quinlivanii]
MSLHVIILAAGLGKRMYSSTPKVLHKLAGKPMLSWVVEAAQSLKPEAVHIIYGNGGTHVREALSSLEVNWVLQEKQLGTGHAVMQALPFIPEEARVLILSADVPLISSETLGHLIRQSGSFNQLSLLLANLDNPFGLGRILRDENTAIYGIVEEKDASEQQRQIREIYSGICCANAGDLKRWLPMLNSNNAQGEYYLTDIIALAVQEEQMVQSITARDPVEIQGVNTPLQLQQLERIWQQRQAEKLLLAGVSIADASRIDIRGELTCGKDVSIDVNCVFIGKVSLGDGCRIGPNCVIRDSHIGAGSEIFPNSVIEKSELGAECHIGPFARLRPGTELASFCKIGNFVETKNVVFDEHSKASHLSYVGDARIGRDVNIGAGTITCNYDGANKHQTVIEDGAFIGSDTQLVAPVTVGRNATVGAGSTIRKNVPADELTLSENRQKTVYGWKRPKKR